ncbi:MAG TPA: glycosyltransferase family 4 protein [Candidatus Saccharimonadales bacterium]|nr:glycosyltransferase family 4 protein [Candidatus Saccharimonadales bacterium]
MTRYTVGLVFDSSLDTADGVSQYVMAVGRWLSEAGHDVHYLVGQTKRRDLQNINSLSRNVSVRFNQNRISTPLPASSRKIKELLARERFDVLHIQMPYSPLLAGKIILAASPQTAVVGTFHIAPYSALVHGGNRLLGVLVRRSLHRFDEVISVSKPAAAFVKATFHMDSSLVPNTRYLDDFYNARPFPALAKKQNIVFLGRLVERKGCQFLLHALTYMVRHQIIDRTTCHVLICGSGPLELSLKRYVAMHQLEDLVDFKGFISEADKPRYLASADIVAYPSTGGESFGIVLLEAMAASRGAVIAGNNPGYAAVLAEHHEALFDPKDSRQFAELLAQLLADRTTRQAAVGWQRAMAHHYDIDRVGPQILSIYRRALHKRPA